MAGGPVFRFGRACWYVGVFWEYPINHEIHEAHEKGPAAGKDARATGCAARFGIHARNEPGRRPALRSALAGADWKHVVAAITRRVWHDWPKPVSSTRRVFADLCSTRRVLGHFYFVENEGQMKTAKAGHELLILTNGMGARAAILIPSSEQY